jgi:tetratricopeptide (TPR) repeat protein
VTELYPTHPHALRALARVLAPNPNALGELVKWDVWLAQNDRLEAAVALWEQAVRIAPQDRQVRGWYALALACLGEHTGAQAQTDQAVAGSRQPLPARLAVMLTALGERDDPGVDSTLEQLAAGLWADPIDRAALTRATLAVGRMDWTEPDQPILYWTVGRLFLLQGRPAEANRALQSLVVRFPDSPWAHRAAELIGQSP